MRFHAKTLLHRYVPGGYGHARRLRRARDPSYVHERDRHPVRRRHQGDVGWRSETRPDGIRHRAYESYDEYVIHQQQKYDEILKLRGGFSKAVIAAWRRKFYRRFRLLVDLLAEDATIVCAGARQGTEVEVLRDLGFRRAYGIDLNPGPDNPFVRQGDFHQLPQADGTVDLVYSNSLDHVYDLDRFFADHARALRSDGYVLYDVSLAPLGTAAPFETLAWEREDALFGRMLRYFERVVHVETEPGWKWILLHGPRTPAPPAASD